jgi:hypothetical protein
MKRLVLAPLAAVTLALALSACGPNGSTTSTSPVTSGSPRASAAASGSAFCVVAQKIVTDQKGVAGAIRAIATNTVSGPDMGTAAGWANRQALAQAAIDATNALLDQYHAAVPLISDPSASGAVIQMAQFYENSVLKSNQKILNFSDQASYITSGDSGSLTAAPTAAQVAVQTYVTAQCGYLRP